MSDHSSRRSSLGMLLKRSKSGDLRKQQALRELELQRQRDAVPKSPPRLPQLYNGAPPTQFFDGEDRPDSLAIVSGIADHEPATTPRSPVATSPSVVSVPPPVPTANGADPYARTESMTNRGRYSYASSAISTINSPRRVRRRKDPTPFNVLIIGTQGSGKTSFLEFLKTSLALPQKKRSRNNAEHDAFISTPPPSGNFIPHYIETEIDGERIGLTLWDSEGLQKNVVDLQLREMAAFLESKFEETFAEEMKVVRSPGVQDTHIHAAFLVLDPARLAQNVSAAKAAPTGGQKRGSNQIKPRVNGALDEDLDLQVLRTLQGKTTVIPVISKADTVTTKHMCVLKRLVWGTLKKANLDPLEALGLDDEEDSSADSNRIDEEDEEVEDEEGVAEGEEDPDGEGERVEGVGSGHGDGEPSGDKKPAIQGRNSWSTTKSKRRSSGSAGLTKAEDDEIPDLPMSIISPDVYDPSLLGRQFPWGFANPYDEEHCDFVRLRDAVFSEWRGDLREASREQWYEGWRTSRLKQREGFNLRR